MIKINYKMKPFDIVFMMVGNDKKIHNREEYFKQPGMDREGVL